MRRSSGSNATAWSKSLSRCSGQASAYRTVRVASLTAQGHDDRADCGAETGRTSGEAALPCSKAAPDGIDTSRARRSRNHARHGQAARRSRSRRRSRGVVSSAIRSSAGAGVLETPRVPLVLTVGTADAVRSIVDACPGTGDFERSCCTASPAAARPSCTFVSPMTFAAAGAAC